MIEFKFTGTPRVGKLKNPPDLFEVDEVNVVDDVYLELYKGKSLVGAFYGTVDGLKDFLNEEYIGRFE